MHRDRPPDSLGKARWEPAQRTALVQRVRGKYMSTMGFNARLFPEEVVFLTDRDEIELCEMNGEGNEEKQVKGARLFAILDEAGVDMKVYTAYSVLCEQHFHVFRKGMWKCPKDKISQLALPQLCCQGRTRSGSGMSDGDEVVQSSSSSSSAAATTTTKRARIEHSNNEHLALSFDCYMPQSGFSKNNMDKPAFSLAIFSANGSLPSVAKLKELIKQADETVPVRLAIVGDSSVSFIEVSDFDPTSQATRLDVDVKR